MELTENRLFSNRQLLRLIIPLVIEQALNVLVGLADGVMVSSAGEAAISGVSLVDMINAVVLTLFMGLATGGAVVTSQYLGARKYHDAQKSVGQLILMAAVIGVAFGGLCLVLSRPILKLFFGSIEADVMEAGLIYFRITALAFPFIALYCTAAAVFRSMGNSKLTMKISILMNLIKVSGNAICDGSENGRGRCGDPNGCFPGGCRILDPVFPVPQEAGIVFTGEIRLPYPHGYDA